MKFKENIPSEQKYYIDFGQQKYLKLILNPNWTEHEWNIFKQVNNFTEAEFNDYMNAFN